MRQHIVIVYINAVWPTINEPGRRRSYVKHTLFMIYKIFLAVSQFLFSPKIILNVVFAMYILRRHKFLFRRLQFQTGTARIAELKKYSLILVDKILQTAVLC
jgi:hypothetical protein